MKGFEMNDRDMQTLRPLPHWFPHWYMRSPVKMDRAGALVMPVLTLARDYATFLFCAYRRDVKGVKSTTTAPGVVEVSVLLRWRMSIAARVEWLREVQRELQGRTAMGIIISLRLVTVEEQEKS